MIDYLANKKDYIKLKDGRTVQVTSPRKRRAVHEEDELSYTITEFDVSRVDVLLSNVGKSFYTVDDLVDANDKDILSLSIGEKIKIRR